MGAEPRACRAPVLRVRPGWAVPRTRARRPWRGQIRPLHHPHLYQLRRHRPRQAPRCHPLIAAAPQATSGWLCGVTRASENELDRAVVRLPAVDRLARQDQLGQLRVDEEHRLVLIENDLVASLHAAGHKPKPAITDRGETELHLRAMDLRTLLPTQNFLRTLGNMQ